MLKTSLWVPAFIRAGGLTVVAVQLVDWFATPHPSGNSSQFLALHLFAILCGFTMVFLPSSTRRVRPWRLLSLASCAGVFASTFLLAAYTGDYGLLFVTVGGMVIGAATLVPWNLTWQTLLSVIGASAFAALYFISPVRDPDGPIHWLGLLAFIGIAEAGTYLNGRYRHDLLRHFQALESSGQQLQREIDLRINAHDKLAESEAALRKILEASPDLIAINRLSDGRFIDINYQFEKLGLLRGQIIGKSLRETGLIEPYTIKKLAAALRDKGYVNNLEIRNHYPSGDHTWLLSASLIEVGGEKCALSISRDVTQMKRTEKSMRESEEKFRRIFDSSLDAISIVRLDGTYVDVNQAFLDSGYKREQVIGRTDVDLGVWVNDTERLDFVSKLARTGRVQGVPVQLKHGDGAVVSALLSAVLVEIGGEYFVVSMVRDIDEIKRTEARLRESEERFRQLFETSMDPVVLSDVDTGLIVDSNQEFFSRFGIAREDIIGRPADWKGWNDRAAIDAIATGIRERGSVRNIAVSTVLPGGREMQMLVSARTLTIGQRRMVASVLHDVTELRVKERELRESEKKFRLIFSASTDLVWLAELESGTILDANDEFLKRTGYSRDETIGRTSRELNVWADGERRVQLIEQLRSSGQLRNIEREMGTRAGARIPVLMSSVVITLDRKLCCLIVARDITDIKHTERVLRESEDKFRQIFEKMDDIVVLSSITRGTVLEVNEEFERQTGYPREYALGKTNLELNLWANLHERDVFFEEMRKAGFVRGMETTMRRRDGTTVPMLVSSMTAPLLGEQCGITVMRDVSKLKEAENELRNSQAVLRRTFDSITDPLTITDLEDGRVYDTNESMLRLTGHARDQVIGKTSRELRLWVNRDQEKQFQLKMLAEGSVRNMEAQFRLADQSAMQGLLSAVTIEYGGRPCALSTVRDITELKQVYYELEAARVAALEASRAKSEFLSSMSHEIRTPMNAILGMADLLSETSLGSEQRRYLDTILANGNALLELINGILDLAKVESGRMSLESAPFDLVDLIEKVADTLAVRAHEKQIELAVRLAPTLPRMVVGDSLRLRQVLTNLVGNAIKFTEQGEVVIGVEADRTDRDGRTLLFSVSDTGIGIDPDKLSTIFSAFTQADSSTTRRYGGSGLGLAIVERLVNLMGGRVWAESEKGRGSVFRFTTRLQPATNVEPPPALREPALAGKRILVVDDNATNRLILREMLGQRGALITEANSAPAGLEAIDYARRTSLPFDLVLVDCRMPSMDGFEMVRRARRSPGGHDLVIMMLSSNGLVATMSKMKEAGLDHFMVKPIKRGDLYAAISQTFAAQAATADGNGASPSQAAVTDRTQLRILDRKLRILLADDSPDNRLLIRAYLKNTPYTIEEAEDGETAIEKFKTDAEGFDLIVMDIQMPRLDGYAAARQIRAWEKANARPRTAIIALTASAFEEDVRRAIEAGCDLHVSKPVKRGRLINSIADAVEFRGGVDGEVKPVAHVESDLKDLIPEFLNRKRRDAEKIAQAARDADFSTLASLGHQLKGEGGSFGFEAMSELGASLQAAANQKDISGAQRLSAQLAAYLEKVQIVYTPGE